MRGLVLKLFAMAGCLSFGMSCVDVSRYEPLKGVEGKQRKGVSMDGKYWRTLYDPNGAFELRIVNATDNDLTGCRLGFNNRFFHPLTGLSAKNESDDQWVTFASDKIEKGEKVKFIFSHEYGNLALFEIRDYTFKKPKTVELVADGDTLQWNFTLTLKQGYF